MSIKEQERKAMIKIVAENEYDACTPDAEWITDALQEAGYGNVPNAIDRFVSELSKYFNTERVKEIAEKFKEEFKK